MAEDELEQLLRRPSVIAAVRDLGLTAVGPEDVLCALRAFGRVRIDVGGNTERPFARVLETGDGREHGRGRTILAAALACWADALDAVDRYSQGGVADLERFLLGRSDPDAEMSQ